ncbi:hypothetical protein OPKNFCMD_1112 [Methylobacterium crusticola]|uniref:Uncharacterized protein n=1 Tax=Methylobacterium crusticola TaxID=1697972 RepID=A0ABQ4QUL3_9HYPH|nr:hypothetical protein [Methylobacterium crusticola]GJD48394.1 hypothetical protein OPKNFCMD_1112 [Methylobacterium crusticola]
MHDVARGRDARGMPLPQAPAAGWWELVPLDLWGAVLVVIAAGLLKLAGILP